MRSSKLRIDRWLLAAVSLCVALAASEALLRLWLFHTTIESAARDPAFYARNLNEIWVYRYLFSPSRRWAVAAGPADASNETQIEFYRKWPTSLVPDGQLGYVRKADVRVPCHETTNLATRGTRDYVPDGRKIAFFGDSFVESAACSNDTLTAKIEKLAGIDALNYGVGGYGLDQMFLYFKRVLPLLGGKDRLYLIGVVQDDLERMLLEVRTSPKPYFTAGDGKLVLHTAHIHADSLNDYYQRPAERIYLYYFLRGRLGYPYYRSMMNETRAARVESVHALSRLLLKEIADLRRKDGIALAFVVFPALGLPFDDKFLSLLRENEIPVVDLRSCLRDRPDTDLFAEQHPTSLGNEMLARCLLRDLAAMQLLR